MLVQGVAIGPLTARVSEARLIVASVSVLSLTLLAWGFVPNVALLLAVFLPMAISAGMFGTILNSALTKSVSGDELGGTLGISTSLQSITQVVAPVLGGFLLGQFGAWSLGVLGALIMGWRAAYAWRNILKATPAEASKAAAGTPFEEGTLRQSRRLPPCTNNSILGLVTLMLR